MSASLLETCNTNYDAELIVSSVESNFHLG